MRQTFEKDGKVRSFEVSDDRVMTTVQIGSKWVANPTLEAFLADGWREYIAPEPTPHQPTYEERVVDLIRQRYTIDDELRNIRMRDTDQDTFNEYYQYVEECKNRAKEEYGFNL